MITMLSLASSSRTNSSGTTNGSKHVVTGSSNSTSNKLGFFSWFSSTPLQLEVVPSGYIDNVDPNNDDTTTAATATDSYNHSVKNHCHGDKRAYFEKKASIIRDEDDALYDISSRIGESPQKDRPLHLQFRSSEHEQEIAKYAQKAAVYTVESDSITERHKLECQNRNRSSVVLATLKRQRNKLLQDSIFCLEAMLKIQRCTATSAQHNDPMAHGLEVASTLMKIGKVYGRIGKVEEALHAFKEALSLQRSASKYSINEGQYDLIVAETLHSIGKIHLRLIRQQGSGGIYISDDFDIHSASLVFQEEFDIRHRSLRKAENNLSSSTMSNMSIELGSLCALIGLILCKNRNYGDAVDTLSDALMYYQRGGLSNDHPSRTGVLRVLGCQRLYPIFLMKYWAPPDVI